MKVEVDPRAMEVTEEDEAATEVIETTVARRLEGTAAVDEALSEVIEEETEEEIARLHSRARTVEEIALPPLVDDQNDRNAQNDLLIPATDLPTLPIDLRTVARVTLLPRVAVSAQEPRSGTVRRLNLSDHRMLINGSRRIVDRVVETVGGGVTERRISRN